MRVFKSRVLVAGAAEGQALVTAEPLSLWGGLCPHTGEIIDRRHELSGSSATGRIFVFPRGRGSSTASATLVESIRNGVAPAAIINRTPDPILALGSIVSDELYHHPIPIAVLAPDDFAAIRSDDYLSIAADGTITLRLNDTTTEGRPNEQ